MSSRVCVVGLGFVGLPLGATLADLGCAVSGVDTAPHVQKSLKSGKAHFTENGIQELLDRVLGTSLTVLDAIEPQKNDIYIIAVGTPVDEKTHEPHMGYVEQASAMIGKALKKNDLVIMRSTVPVGVTRNVVLPILERESGLRGGEDFDCVFAPERLVSGKALQELRELPQIIGGLRGGRDVERASDLFRLMTDKIVIVENLEAGELGKLMDNTYRDLHFAYANQMALLGEAVGIDLHRLVHDVNRDYKRNRIPVPSPGVGGICLMKDSYLLMSVGKKYDVDLGVTRAARTVNEEMPQHVADRIVDLLKKAGKDPKGAVVFVLGFAFKGKPETSDCRNAPTTDLVSHLHKAGCKILGHDPVVPHEHMESLNVKPISIEEGFKEADAAVIMTNHSTYESLEITKLIHTMKKPAVLLDGWHLFDPELLRSIPELHYAGVGISS